MTPILETYIDHKNNKMSFNWRTLIELARLDTGDTANSQVMIPDWNILLWM